MSRVCDICGRGAGSGHAVSHSNIKTLRRFNVNLQTRKIDGKKKKVCTKCLKKIIK